MLRPAALTTVLSALVDSMPSASQPTAPAKADGIAHTSVIALVEGGEVYAYHSTFRLPSSHSGESSKSRSGSAPNPEERERRRKERRRKGEELGMGLMVEHRSSSAANQMSTEASPLLPAGSAPSRANRSNSCKEETICGAAETTFPYGMALVGEERVKCVAAVATQAWKEEQTRAMTVLGKPRGAMAAKQTEERGRRRRREEPEGVGGQEMGDEQTGAVDAEAAQDFHSLDAAAHPDVGQRLPLIGMPGMRIEAHRGEPEGAIVPLLLDCEFGRILVMPLLPPSTLPEAEVEELANSHMVLVLNSTPNMPWPALNARARALARHLSPSLAALGSRFPPLV